MSGIPYVTKSWNPAVGCKECSPGCAHCWAKRMAQRQRIEWGQITTKPERLDQPLHWRKPQIVAVGFMSDIALWPDEFLDKVFAVMALTPQHTYLLLTKRPERMRRYLAEPSRVARVDLTAVAIIKGRMVSDLDIDGFVRSVADDATYSPPWPLPNVWLGVSVENQETADERIPLLLETPAAHRWVSAEPLLGAVDLHSFLPCGDPVCEEELTFLDWIVVGGESGPHSRPMLPYWLAQVVLDCEPAGVKVYCKQDSGPRPGMQGRLPDALWAVKQLPGGWA